MKKNLKSQKKPFELTQKYPQNLQTPKIFIFYPPPPPKKKKEKKFIEIQGFKPHKMTRAYVCVKISEYTPPGTGPVYMSTKYQG